SRYREQFRVGDHSGYQSKLRRPPGIERLSRQDQLGRTEVSSSRRNRAARPELRNQGKIDERHLEFCVLTCEDEVAVCQHGGSTADRGTLHGGDDWFVEANQRLH